MFVCLLHASGLNMSCVKYLERNSPSARQTLLLNETGCPSVASSSVCVILFISLPLSRSLAAERLAEIEAPAFRSEWSGCWWGFGGWRPAVKGGVIYQTLTRYLTTFPLEFPHKNRCKCRTIGAQFLKRVFSLCPVSEFSILFLFVICSLFWKCDMSYTTISISPLQGSWVLAGGTLPPGLAWDASCNTCNHLRWLKVRFIEFLTLITLITQSFST